MMIAGPRVYFAMARDRLFLPTAGVVDPKSHVPAHAIIAQALWSGVLVLSGTLSQLVSSGAFLSTLLPSTEERSNGGPAEEGRAQRRRTKTPVKITPPARIFAS